MSDLDHAGVFAPDERLRPAELEVLPGDAPECGLVQVRRPEPGRHQDATAAGPDAVVQLRVLVLEDRFVVQPARLEHLAREHAEVHGVGPVLGRVTVARGGAAQPEARGPRQRQRVTDGRAGHAADRPAHVRRARRLEQADRGADVVRGQEGARIHPGDHVAPRRANPDVQSGRDGPCRAVQQPDPRVRARQRLHDVGRPIARPAVDHDDLDPIGRVVLAEHRGQAGLDRASLVAEREDHRDRRRAAAVTIGHSGRRAPGASRGRSPTGRSRTP